MVTAFVYKQAHTYTATKEVGIEETMKRLSPISKRSPESIYSRNSPGIIASDESASSDDDDANDTTMIALNEVLAPHKDSVKTHPRILHAKRALRLVRKMEKITNSKAFQKALSSTRMPSDSSSGEENDEDVVEQASSTNERGKLGSSNNSAQLLPTTPKARLTSPTTAKQPHQQQSPPTSPRQQQKHKQKENTDAMSGMAKLRAMHGIESMQTNPDSAFSSEKLCKEFSIVARIASGIVKSTDDITEVVLEERGQVYTNPDILPHCRDCAAFGSALKSRCGTLLDCATRFCGAAERVLKGAREEVRCVSSEVVALHAQADALHAALEEKKSQLAKRKKTADDLRAANDSRSLCLGASLSEEDEEEQRHDTGSISWDSTAGDDTQRQSSCGSSQELGLSRHQKMKTRLRMLLSAAVMQIRGQKHAEEIVGDATGASTTRIMNAFDTVLNAM